MRKIALIALLAAMPTAHAGTYGDAFGKCLVSSSTDSDKQQLMEWIYSAIALNPSIRPYSSITSEQREIFDKSMATLFERLVGDSCRKEASEALKYEGASAFGTAFQLFGEVAGQQLFASPEVAKGSQEFYKHVDNDALQKKLGVTPSEP
jgi:hypothetical protein